MNNQLVLILEEFNLWIDDQRERIEGSRRKNFLRKVNPQELAETIDSDDELMILEIYELRKPQAYFRIWEFLDKYEDKSKFLRR